MGWSGGTFSRVHDWTTDEGGAIDIEADRMDAEDDNFRDGINDCLHKAGQNTAAGDLPMGGYNHTAVGNATALDEYASASDVIDQDLIYYVDSGAADAYVITPATPAITAYEEGQRFVFRASAASTGASTLNVNALGATTIETVDGNDLLANMIIVGGIYEVTYDANGSRFVLTSPNSLTQVFSSTDMIAGTGMTGGGTLASDRTFNVIGGTGLTENADDIALSHLGLEALTDPGADRVLFWDDTAGAFKWLEVSTGLDITGTVMTGDNPGVRYVTGTNQTRNSTITPTDVTSLSSMPLTAGVQYAVRGVLAVSLSGTTPGFRFIWTFTNANQYDHWQVRYVDNTGAIYDDTNASMVTPDITWVPTLATTGVITIDAVFQANASTGGTLSLQFAQSVSDAASATIFAGSYLEVIPLS